MPKFTDHELEVSNLKPTEGEDFDDFCRIYLIYFILTGKIFFNFRLKAKQLPYLKHGTYYFYLDR